MNKKFVPYFDKILIKPIVQTKVIKSPGEIFEEMGEVIAVGDAVKWLRPGDIIFFVSHAVWKTPKEEDGTQHWVVNDGPSFILGKYDK